MKKTTFLILCGGLLCSAGNINAQSWNIGGNPNADVPAAGGQFGTNGNRLVIFETNGIERARMMNTSGFWGFNTTAPNARVHINSPAGENPFRVQVAGLSKLYVDNGGGVSVGSASIPPANGLFVSGSAGIGISAPAVKLHVTGGVDASPGGGGYIVAGSINGANVVIDENEIMARNNGATSNLFLNHNGGDLVVNGVGSGGLVVGTTAAATGFRSTINETTNAALILGTLNGVGSYLTVNRPSTSSSGEVVRIRDNGTTFATFNDIAATYQLTVTGDALASGGMWVNSDKRIKRDIKPITSAMDKLMKLNPSVYYFNRDEIKYKYLNLPKEQQFGLIAQEVKEVFPNIVREYKTHDEDGKERSETVHSINYTSLIPVLIKGMQEQQNTIAALQEKIAKLENALNSITSKTGLGYDASSASLEQNQPNPFNQTTIIRYKIPAGANAQINVYNASGAMIKTMRATENGQAQINAGELRAGTYTYTLVVNGKQVASKKMVMLK